MSKKNKRKRNNRPKGQNLFQRVQQNLSRGNLRQAVKDAKVCFRDEASEQNRQLLAKALHLRIEELVRSGKHDQGRSLLGALLELGPADPEIQAELPRLRVVLGLAGEEGSRERAELFESDPRLLVLLADQVVLHPEQTSAADATVRQNALAVRSALESIERGDHEAASHQLKEIPRQSPFADWRVFARGLSAFYARQWPRVTANWDRLDPERPAYRIAQTLLVASGQLKADDSPLDVTGGLRRLQSAAGASPVCDLLRAMVRQWHTGRMSQLLQSYRTFRLHRAKSHPVLLEKMTDLLWKTLVRRELARELERFCKVAPGPALDRNWNRALALLAEHSSRQNLDAIEDRWRQYIDDLRQTGCLPKPERDIAIGLVCRHLAREFITRTEPRKPYFWMRKDGWDEDARRERAAHYLNEGLRCCPQLLSAHRDLIDLYLQNDEVDEALEASRTLLEQFPDDFQTLVWMANYYLEMDKPGDAEKYAQAAQRLKPRDPSTVALVWNQRVGMIRHCTRKRKFQLARQELARLAEMSAPEVPACCLDLMRATVEWKAQNQPEAEKHLDTALSRLDEPTAIWMMLHTYATRFGLSRQIKNDFRDRFKAAIKNAPRSQTAGHVAQFLLGYLIKQVKYTGFATHQRLFTDYLQRSIDIDWQQQDLRNVCLFLSHLDSWKHRDLVGSLAARGMSQFPEEPLFPCLRALQEMKRGPVMADRAVILEHAKRTLVLNEQAEKPLPEVYVNSIRKALALIDERDAAVGRPDSDEDDEYFDEFFDEDDEYDEDDEAAYFDDDEDDEDEFVPNRIPRLPPGMTAARFRAMLPKEMMEEMEAAAEELGVDVIDLLRRIMTGEIDPEGASQEFDAGSSSPRRRSRSKRKGRKATSRV